ncbi:MAG: DM13 domain-containing protein [Anaerolineae bacterium]|nr:DM13 domain-containing protein [Anaerolineae bacterium]MDW8299810.1 DM13 domain-containing protein [Anaerolineae bacterium]
MRYRPRWTLLTFGALVVLALFTFPTWRTLFMRPAESLPFPLTSAERRQVLLRLPNREMAATMYFSSLTAQPVPTEQQPAPVPPDAQVILTARFAELDALRSARGTVTFYRLIDDSVLLRFDDFEVTNAPQLAVYLSSNEAPQSVQELGGIVPEFPVGELVGTFGSQQFVIPRELRLERYRSVVIVSEGLQLIYGIARLR